MDSENYSSEQSPSTKVAVEVVPTETQLIEIVRAEYNNLANENAARPLFDLETKAVIGAAMILLLILLLFATLIRFHLTRMLIILAIPASILCFAILGGIFARERLKQEVKTMDQRLTNLANTIETANERFRDARC